MGVARMFFGAEGGGTLFQKKFQSLKNIQQIFKKHFKNVSKSFKNLSKKIAKICIILTWFSHNLTMHGVNFCAFGRKMLFAENL